MLVSDIAKEAKVSPATVSRAFNRPEIVAPATLARIRSVMEKHHYVPAPVAHRRGPKTRLGEMFRPTAHRRDVVELVMKSVDFFQLASLHEANGGALILRYSDGRETRLCLL